MQLYRHRQVGTLVLVALGGGVVLTAAIFIGVREGRIVTGLVLAVLLLCVYLFHALTVEVSTDEVVAWFGPGVIRKRFRMDDIQHARAVKNRWYYGWGIRLTPHGWLFNVSGSDAVELGLKDDRKFRIGTDDPEGLVSAIEMARRRNSR